jgi:hypothetical protein
MEHFMAERVSLSLLTDPNYNNFSASTELGSVLSLIGDGNFLN